MSKTEDTWWRNTPSRAPVDESQSDIIDDDTLPSGCIEHDYGDAVYIHTAAKSMCTLLARLCSRQTKQPFFNQLMRKIYQRLLDRVIDYHFDDRLVSVPTPMVERAGEKGIWHGLIIDPEMRVVIAEVARAGCVPAEEIFSILTGVINEDLVRKDLMVMARRSGPDHRVTGTDCGASKIGGSLNGATLLIPEPMCATGSTIDAVLDQYGLDRDNPPYGVPDEIIVLSLIVTPEFLDRMAKKHPKVQIHTVRVDRGNSSERALKANPGVYWNEESGLDGDDYILPGAGGVGERSTNAFV